MNLSVKRFLAFIVDIIIISSIICFAESLVAIVLHFFQGIFFISRPFLLGWEFIIIPFLFFLRDVKFRRFLSVGNSIFGLNVLFLHNDVSEKAGISQIILRTIIFFYLPLILFALFFSLVNIDMFELMMWKKAAHLKVLLLCGFGIFILFIIPLSILLNKGKLGIHDWLSKTYVMGKDFAEVAPVFNKKIMLASLSGSLAISILVLFIMTMVVEHSGESVKDIMKRSARQMGFLPNPDINLIDILNFSKPVESFSKYKLPLGRYYIREKLLDGDIQRGYKEISDIRELVFEYYIYPEKLKSSISLINNEVIPEGTDFINLSFWVSRPCYDIMTLKYSLIEGAVSRMERIFPEIKWVSVKINRGVRFNMIVVGSYEHYWVKMDDIESSFIPLSEKTYSQYDSIVWSMLSGIYFSNRWPFVVSTVGKVFK